MSYRCLPSSDLMYRQVVSTPGYAVFRRVEYVGEEARLKTAQAFGFCFRLSTKGRYFFIDFSGFL
ncbi:MAG: hypothetical protein ACK55Z_06580, partial [bacterium]